MNVTNVKTISKPTILILYYSSSRVCGIGTWVETLYHELNRGGWKVTVGLAWGRRFHQPKDVEEFRPGMQTVWMDGRTGTEEGRIQAIERTIRKTRPDIVILTSLNSAFEAVRRLRQKGINFRFIVTNHGNFSRQAACLLSHRADIDLAVCIGRQSLAGMLLPPDGFSPERIRHIPNGVLMPLKKKKQPLIPFRVGYAGRLDTEQRKRVSDIIPFFHELVRLHPSIEFWIAGSGTLEAATRELAENNHNYIKYFGSLTKEKLYEDFYPQIDIFVNFSSNEAFGLSIAEAMAHGVVPVTSDFYGIQIEGLVIDGFNSLIFPVSDTNRAVALVTELLNDPKRLEKMSNQAISHIRDNFSSERFGQAWSEVLEYCLSLPPLSVPSKPPLFEKGRFGIREKYWEYARRILRRRVPHSSPGEEWPHFICRDEELICQVAEAMEEGEVAC